MLICKQLLQGSLFWVLVITLSACGSMGKKIENYNFLTDVSGLVLDKSAEPTVVYVRPTARVFSTYNSFIIDPVKISYSDPKMKKIDADDLARIQRYFRERVVGELNDEGYKVTSHASADTMRISFILSGIKAPSAAPNIVAALAPIALSVGEVTVEAVFSESMTNRIDAVAVHRAQGSRVLNAKPWSTWDDIESSFDKWAKGIAKAITTQHQSK